MRNAASLEELLAHCIDAGLSSDSSRLAELCADQPERLEELRAALEVYHGLDQALGGTGPREQSVGTPPIPPRLPGYRCVERLGGGGGGEVYKLEDEQLGRVVAAKVMRPNGSLGATVADVLNEARSLALFDDPRVVRLFELNEDHHPPVLLMEYVDGFDLAAIGPSLEPRQQAQLMAEVADAVHGAHRKGLVHGDLKPANILVDRELKPHILDFGLAATAGRGRPGRGTLAYMAPEQLATPRSADAASDLYALGVTLYELLCGCLPFDGATEAELRAAILRASPQLPTELDAALPPSLQAITLKAMEPDPKRRYATALDMARDLERFADGRPVLARPSQVRGALAEKITSHVEQVREWLRLRLIHAHEAAALERVYDRLKATDDDWIVHGRSLSWSRIVLYLGAFLLLMGSGLFFGAYVLEALRGVLRPLLTLGLPCVGLTAVGFALLERDRRAVAVAFFLAATAILPLAMVVVLREGGVFSAAGTAGQLFTDAWVSNRQLQVAWLVAAMWALCLALKTRTAALASASVAMLCGLHVALLGDVGLRRWVEEGRWDLLAFWLGPLVVVLAVAGRSAESRNQSWYARPLYFSAAALLVAVLELLALDGRAMALLGLTLGGLQSAEVSDPQLLDTLAVMAGNGLLIYGLGWALDRTRSADLAGPAAMLLMLSPFATLEPLLVLNATGEYSLRFLWLYLAVALVVTLASHFRQRRSFYAAGISNTGVALWQIFSRYEWFDRPWRATVVILCGLALLAAGWALDQRERRQAAGE